MANQLASLPWTIDTVSDTPLSTKPLKVIRIAFTGYTDPTHAVEVHNGAGRLVCRLDGNTDLEEIESYFTGWIQGLTVPTTQSITGAGAPNMASGLLVVMLE